jgi:peroxiredoxin
MRFALALASMMALSLACAAVQKPAAPAAADVPAVAPKRAPAIDAKPAPARVELKVGQQAPWLASFDLEGNPLSLAKVLTRKGSRGAVVVFWAAWCEACKHELDLVSADRTRLAEAGVEVLLVNVLDDSDKLGAIVKEKHLAGLSLIRDGSGAVAESYGLADQGKATAADKVALPLAVAVSANGQSIRRIWREASDGFVDEVIDALKNDPVRGRLSP